jgi:hypothetical protein
MQESTMLVEAMLESMAVDLMTARLVSLNEAEEDEAEAVNAILQCFQNLGEIEAKALDALAEKPQLIKWLLRRLQPREFKQFTPNKAAAAELLAILAQVSSSIAASTSQVDTFSSMPKKRSSVCGCRLLGFCQRMSPKARS